MSNIYIQEPPTSGKILLKTTVGDIDIELWSKEAPLACRNFVQLCLEGYYNNTIFHRIVKGFIVQGGDPTGTGTGGESIYGEPFKDEIHSRLHFNRRGLVAMANAGKNDNGSQFFFTLASTPELQKKHTIFGKVAGKTIYNMVKLEEGLVEDDDRPVYPNKIVSTEILNNPFPDIVPRIKKTEEKKESPKKKSIKGVKNYKLLSFGEEAEDDEEELEVVNKKFMGKTKCVPGLVEIEEDEKNILDKRKYEIDDIKEDESSSKIFKTDINDTQLTKAEIVRNKLNPSGKKHDRFANLDEKLKLNENKIDSEIEIPIKKVNRLIEEYEKEKIKYKDKKNLMPRKGKSREEQTLELLMKFKQKINNAKHHRVEEEEEDEKLNKNKVEEWMAHSLKCEDSVIIAKDANVKSDDWFEITDPRNTLNKRRRENNKMRKSRIKENL